MLGVVLIRDVETVPSEGTDVGDQLLVEAVLRPWKIEIIQGHVLRIGRSAARASSRRAAKRAARGSTWLSHVATWSRTARTVDGHQRARPCAVGVPAASSSLAICARLRPPHAPYGFPRAV